jgi:hypothetical protein
VVLDVRDKSRTYLRNKGKGGSNSKGGSRSSSRMTNKKNKGNSDSLD